MNEYISKEIARSYLEKACECIGGNGGLMLKIKFDEEPSADVRENVHGEWIHKDGIYGVTFCSKCDFELHINNSNFCPNCGADMKKEVEE